MFYFHTCSLVSFFSELNTVGAWTAGIDMNFPFVFTCTLVVFFYLFRIHMQGFQFMLCLLKNNFVFVGRKKIVLFI